MKRCQDPTFIGTAVYANVEYKTIKLSRLVSAKERTDGSVDFTTQNTHYIADFSSERARSAFINTCKTIGRLELC